MPATPNDQEYKETAIFALPLDEASAKVRTGPPLDPDEDLALDVWAGVIPLRTVAGEPEPAPDLTIGYRPAGLRHRLPSPWSLTYGP